MKIRWTSLGVAITLAVALTVGFAFASDHSMQIAADRRGSAAITQTDGWAAMEALHDSPAMQRLHAQMPEEVQAQCEAMHDQMEEMMGAGGMMGGDTSAHHSGTAGGMMGSASSDMMES